MELISLHPMRVDAAEMYVQLISSSSLPSDGNTRDLLAGRFWYDRIAQRENPRPNDVSFGFGAWLATQQPVFAQQGLGLSNWEARVDRGSGMLLRPPSRLFIDAGLDQNIARGMPIRIEAGDSLMGGAFVPARLMAQYLERLEHHLERSVRRLQEAELDSAVVMGLMVEAARYASERGFGLYEMVDLLDPTDRNTWPPDVRIVTRPTDKALQERIQRALKPQKEPGLIARLFKRDR